VTSTAPNHLSFNGWVDSSTAVPTFTSVNSYISGVSLAPHLSVSSCSAPFLSWAGGSANSFSMWLW